MFVPQRHSSLSTRPCFFSLHGRPEEVRGQLSVQPRQGCTTPARRLALFISPTWNVTHFILPPSPLITLTSRGSGDISWPAKSLRSSVEAENSNAIQIELKRKGKKIGRRKCDSVRLRSSWPVRKWFQSHRCTVVSRKWVTFHCGVTIPSAGSFYIYIYIWREEVLKSISDNVSSSVVTFWCICS